MLPRLLSLSPLLFLLGCGPSGPALVPVSGTVMLDDKPVAGANVMFVPAAGKPAFGLTDEGGKYTLTTVNPNDGAYEGQYNVAVIGMRTTGVEVGADGTELDVSKAHEEWFVPKKYARHESSGLTQTVTKGMGSVDWKLSSK